MGVDTGHQYSRYCLSMKLLVALALFGLACAAPDADAWYGYRGYRGYYRPYGYWYGKRSADETAASGPNPDADAHGWGYGGYYRPYYYGHYYGKRSANPNPQYQGWAVYSGGYYGR